MALTQFIVRSTAHLPRDRLHFDIPTGALWRAAVNKDMITGSCLCGAVTFAMTPPYSAFRYCHCTRCRKASGSAHAANLFVPAAQFEWRKGEASVRRFDLPNAERFSRWFCGECGCRVPHKVKTRDDFLVPAGLLDAEPGIRPQNSIFWGSKADWYVEPRQIPTFREYPE